MEQLQNIQLPQAFPPALPPSRPLKLMSYNLVPFHLPMLLLLQCSRIKLGPEDFPGEQVWGARGSLHLGFILTPFSKLTAAITD